ncbi:FAD-binding protein [Actinophytocola oryzae]|uniref:3-oxo-5alpha-steroid 4-dehydrogenase n=1 Tax=Actinophytocola oryzae TaxID=502181 RepID=A0A4V3FTR6_9PSEU|nr:FAD-binding protein [Actinophytocola oryzae]TDV52381.1 3-oxo-5alpha-steroid 4-dehydrogenase [Actinophytocola oryzae]
MPLVWDSEADVVVVGFGGAGACAALEAARAGASVVAVDRFTGGGATAMSGGIVYAGGGTSVQRAAGVTDTVDEMLAYLRQEVGDVVSPGLLEEFCRSSASMVDWLAEAGVPFDSSVCPYKTSYPSNRYYLYYSGSENAWPFRSVATPAPRGHRVHGRGTSGRVMYAALASAAHDAGVHVVRQTTATKLIIEGGRVVGVECRTHRSRLHRFLHRYATKPGLYLPAFARRLYRGIAALEASKGRVVRIRARRGVILAAGGFVNNRDMVRANAPAFRGGLPLGTQGDDGSGIQLGTSAGGVTDRMSTMSAWRFLTPPSALIRGILVDRSGARFVDESSYGAAIGERLVLERGGRAWLLVDEAILRDARRQVRTETLWFQRLSAHYLLRVARVRGATVEEVAAKAGIDPEGLAATVEKYGDGEDAFGKHPDLVAPMTGPYALIDCSFGPRLGYPCPTLTLGGLKVDEGTGQVRGADGAGIPGLYAAGRNAVGICSNSYVSGLSLADCVFSGRRAGRFAAGEVSSEMI